MLKRRKIREIAMQILFLWDTQQERLPEAADRVAAEGTEDHETRRQAIEMAAGAWGQRQSIDQWIERLAPQWPPRRQPAVDRSLLRMAVWELTNTVTPAKVVIDEAIELAKQFSTEQSGAFINGVLDAVRKEHEKITSEKREAGSENEESRSEKPEVGSEKEESGSGDAVARIEDAPNELPG